MPILLPIDDESLGTVPLAVAVGSSLVQATLSVANRIRGATAGFSQVSGALRLGASGALAITGAAGGVSSTGARLRLNSEVNVNFVGSVAGTSGPEGTMLARLSGLSARAEGSSLAAASLSVERAGEFGFTFFLDLVDAAVQGAGSSRRYAARLKASGVELPARSIIESAQAGALGVSLDVTLATPNRSLVTSQSLLSFEVGVWNGTSFDWVTIMDGGKMSGDRAAYANQGSRPADKVSFGTLDLLADRWTRAPEAPVTLYDPQEVDEPANTDARSLVHDEQGNAITPVNRAIYGLTMREVLRQAYVEGCGFESVVTNIPDFPVSASYFTLEGGYHAGVLPLVSLFEPMYFAVGEQLWIVDADAALPAGLTPLQLSDADVKAIDDTRPPRQAVSKLIVEYKEDARAGGDYFTERLEQERSEAGRFGSPGYTLTETTRRVREYRSFSAPETIVRSAVVEVETKTTDTDFQIIGRETQADTFDALGRKARHTRRVEARVPDLSSAGALTLQTVSDETYTIIYRPAAASGSDEIAMTTTEVSGLVLVDKDRPYLDKPYEIPYTDAHQSGYIDTEANQSAEFKAIRTVTEEYVREGGSVEVRRQVANHLNGGSVENSTSQTRAGSIAVSRRAQSTVRRMVTTSGGSSTGRTVPTFSAGDIPGDRARELARRKLRRLNNPPRQVSITLPYLDFRLRRGQIVEAHARGGLSLGVFIVEGYTRRFEALEAGNQKFSMTLTARQITA